jgi:hypothetical protein
MLGAPFVRFLFVLCEIFPALTSDAADIRLVFAEVEFGGFVEFGAEEKCIGRARAVILLRGWSMRIRRNT